MRLGYVIGRITLSQQEATYSGCRLLLVQPFDRGQYEGAPVIPLAPGNSLVVYDNLGAGSGNVIGYIEGPEAGMPFPQPSPVDAFNAAIVDDASYSPPSA